MPAFFACLICGPTSAGLMPASRSIRFAFCVIAEFIPPTHSVGWPWFGHGVAFRPTLFATLTMLFMIVVTNGTLLVAGMMNIFLPFIAARASNAGPGALKAGTPLDWSIFACRLAM